MELWIRSQDKNKLMIVNSLYIPISRTDEDFGIYAKDEIRDELLGIYKTKERALEVLDEIDKRISLINSISLVTDINTLISFKNAVSEDAIKGLSYPYQMPKE